MSVKRQESGYVDNWQARKTLTQCNLRMLETEDFSDVTFRVGSREQVVRAHRYVLVSRSCVFHAMFCGLLAGKGEVTITDIEADIFKEFLRYIYTDEVRINAETVTALMYTSNKYSLDALYDLCVTFLEVSLSEDNVCQILEQCHRYGELDLEQKALKILTEGGERVTKSPGFVGLCSDCLGKLLKSDTLNMKEEDVFEAVLSWTKERCRKEGVSDTPENRQRLLGDLRYEIPFTSLSQEYLTKVVGSSGLLTAEERVRIMDRAFDPTVDISPFVVIKGDACKYVQRFATVLRAKCNRAGGHALSFSVNHRINLKGFQLYGGYDNMELPVGITLLDNDGADIIERLQTDVQLLGRGQMTDILFSQPVLLQPGSTYTLLVAIGFRDSFPRRPRGFLELWGYWSQKKHIGYNGLNGKQTVTSDGVQFTFSDARKYFTETTALTGNIPGFIFSIPTLK
ncbi:BTB/POZ domain-containing protein 6-like [Haliotis rubra]|uniref:BTB/POZ domain-containing protein 6-like n=1 Tax=Haliotis rubra TaxID=36100 RepID=UPI001EE5E41E|nr:BTB/POZ domain-containing protein 6-like [Haliotis rubra]